MFFGHWNFLKLIITPNYEKKLLFLVYISFTGKLNCLSLLLACLSIIFTIFDFFYTESKAVFRGFSLSVSVYTLLIMAAFECNFGGDPRFWKLFSLVGAVSFCVCLLVEGVVDMVALFDQKLQKKEVWWLLGSVVCFLHSALFACLVRKEARFVYGEYKKKKKGKSAKEEEGINELARKKEQK